jgi:pyrroline-5-carboxylate reductase
MQTEPVIGFIGGGNMARSLVGGLIARGHSAEHLIVADPIASQRELLEREYRIRTKANNADVASVAQALILAVKPQEMRAVCASIDNAVSTSGAIIISVAAGIRAADISRWLRGTSVIRAMPNRPALHGCGVTGLYATANVTADARALAAKIMSAVGPVVWIDEEHHMDAVTAISGSGPAYFFLLIEMLEEAGRNFGLSAEVSHRLAVETAYGAGFMARGASESPAILREQVTSKGGTTAAALERLEAHNVRAIFAEAVAAAERRSAEFAVTLGDQTPG